MIIGKSLTALGGGGLTASIFVTGLSETDTVTATNESKTKTGVWTQKPNPAIVVPNGYTQLEYIESTGTQYINTGIIPSNDLIAHFTNFTPSSETSYYEVYLGSQSADNASDSWQFRRQSSTTNFILDIYGETRVGSAMANNCDIVLDGTGITVNGVKTSFSPSTISASYSLWIFASNTGGSAFRPSKASFSTLTLSNGSGLLRNYIPAKRVSDGEIGLYDLVSNAFFTNSGTGTFTAGTEIPPTIDGFLIDKIKDYGTWTVTATDGTNTATQDVLVDVITKYEIEMSLSA